MGASFSAKNKAKSVKDKREIKRSQAIDAKSFDESVQDRKIIKLLLLGAGESGKSTLFKQTQRLYGKGFDRSALESYTQIIYRNILQGMHELVRQSDILEGEKFRINSSLAASKSFFLTIKPQDLSEGKVDKVVGDHIIALWADPALKLAYAERAKFQLPDSASYFFDTEVITRIAQEDYVPVYEDILRCRSRTTGIVESDFVIKGYPFKIMDVGGQRSERKKWIHCFEDVTAVIFVAAINEYDQTLYEDNSTNRVHEALELFDKTCNSKWFGNASIILFLNKKDLFEEKIAHVDMSCCFPDYKGGCDAEAAQRFLKDKFHAANKQDNVKIFDHITCATDQDNVRFTFVSVKKIVINSSLQKSGLA